MISGFKITVDRSIERRCVGPFGHLRRVACERTPAYTMSPLEIPIEYDPDFGRIVPEEDLGPEWAELARVNVKDEPELRAERISELRRLLSEKGLKVLPGDDWQMLMFLRAACCDPKKAVDVVQYFLQYRQYICKGMKKCVLEKQNGGRYTYSRTSQTRQKPNFVVRTLISYCLLPICSNSH